MSESMFVATVPGGTGGGAMAPVRRLKASLARHLPGARLVCLGGAATDGVERLSPAHRLPGRWARVELFRPGAFPFGARVIFIAPDCLVVDDLAGLAGYRGRFGCLGDFRRPGQLGDQILAWQVPYGRAIYARFMADPRAAMRVPGGLAGFIRETVSWPDILQDRLPGQIVSYRGRGGGWRPDCATAPPPGSALVCFNGHPKPGEVAGRDPAGWVARALTGADVSRFKPNQAEVPAW